MYVQQAMTKDIFTDVNALFKMISEDKLVDSFKRIKYFLPSEIRKFWEEAFGDSHQSL